MLPSHRCVWKSSPATHKHTHTHTLTHVPTMSLCGENNARSQHKTLKDRGHFFRIIPFNLFSFHAPFFSPSSVFFSLAMYQFGFYEALLLLGAQHNNNIVNDCYMMKYNKKYIQSLHLCSSIVIIKHTVIKWLTKQS